MSKVRKNIDLIAKHGRKLFARKREPKQASDDKLKPKLKLASRFKLPPLADLPPLPSLPQLPEMASDIRSVQRRSAIVGAFVMVGLLGMGWRA